MLISKFRSAAFAGVMFMSSTAAFGDDFVGTIQHIIEDFHLDEAGKPNRHKEAVLLEVTEGPSKGSFFEVKASGRKDRDKLNELRTGSKVRLKGKRQGTELVLEAADGDGTTVEVVKATESVAALAGERRAIAILGNFSNSNLSCTSSTVRNILFDSTSGARSVTNVYGEASYGSVSWAGTAVGAFTIPYSTADGCNYTAWATALNSAAQAAGVDLTQYQHKVYVVPSGAGCSWAGLAYVNGGSSWVASCGTGKIYAHELGHNVGMRHASTPTSEYGDSSDFMGSSGYFPVNGPHRGQMAWIPSTQIATFSGGGRYEVGSLDHPVGSLSLPRMLKILKPGTTNDFYYVSYRTPEGFTSTLGTLYQQRLNIHRQTSTGVTTFLSGLSPGQSFTEAADGIAITLASTSSGSAVFEINSQCLKKAPSVQLLTNPLIAGAGASPTFSTRIQNMDSGTCGSADISVSFTVPSVVLNQPAALVIPLAAGASVDLPVALSISSEALEGSYALRATATNSGASASADGVLVIDNTAPSIPSGVVAAVVRKYARISWTASSDTSGLAFYRVYRNGALVGSPLGTAFTEQPGAGTHEYQVSAVDRAANESARSAPVSVTFSGGSGRKNGGR